jgi:hypothetical protein
MLDLDGERLSLLMILLSVRTIGFVMLRDLRRCDQSTIPPATAIIMFPIAQLMVVRVRVVK